jgi:hypothetical protein
MGILTILSGFKIQDYLKWTVYIAVFAVFAYVIWDVNSAYKERNILRVENKVQADNIKTLEIDVQTQKKIKKEVEKRYEELKKVDKERIVYVDKVKKGDTKYIETVKKEIQYIKETQPEALPSFYAQQYNELLDCIAEQKDAGELSCDIQ